MLYTTLRVETEAGLVLPDWTENIYPDKLESLAARSYSLYTESNLMKKVKGGAFLAEIIKKMENKRRKNLNPDRKIFLYSGHDITLVNIMNTLNILDQTDALPNYASALSFELHHSSLFKDDFEVKVNPEIYILCIIHSLFMIYTYAYICTNYFPDRLLL